MCHSPEFNRNPAPNEVARIQLIHADKQHDARPTIAESRRNRCKRAWCIGFKTASYEHTFEVEIIDFQCEREIVVYAYLDGDEFLVFTPNERRERIAEYVVHQPHPSGDLEKSCTEAEIIAEHGDKWLAIDQSWFWDRVQDCVRRYDAAMFLFQM